MANFKNTDQMFYDLDNHRYILTKEDIVDKYGISLDELDSDGMIDPERLPELFLDRCSKMLYEYLYLLADDPGIYEYYLSLERNRRWIQAAMEEYVYSLLIENTDPSVFFANSSLKPVKVPPSVQTILKNHNLIYRGGFYNIPPDWKSKKGVDY